MKLPGKNRQAAKILKKDVNTMKSKVELFKKGEKEDQ